MRIYVASSWKNGLYDDVVARLRSAGHSVYDFRASATAFDWRACATEDQLRDPRRFRDEVLTNRVAVDAFESDIGALRAADATVLVLPCGRSAHLELGFAVARGQRTIVLLDKPLSEPDLMYLAVGKLAVSLNEVVETLREWRLE